MSFHWENKKYRSNFLQKKMESNIQNLRHPKERTGKVFCPQIHTCCQQWRNNSELKSLLENLLKVQEYRIGGIL